MITLFIIAVMCVNEYLDNLCHMDRSTGTAYAFSNRRNIYRNFERLQCSLEFSKLRWKYRWKADRIKCLRSLAVNILTTDNTIPLFCRLLWTYLKFVTRRRQF
jgi:hypothetical protein